jgi:hypothetical protein
MIARNEKFSFLSIKKITLFILFVANENRFVTNQADGVSAGSLPLYTVGGSQGEESHNVANPAVSAVSFRQRVRQAV